MTIGIITGKAIAKSGQVLLARIVGASGSNITQGSLSAITYRVRDIDGATSGSETSLTIADVVYDTLQTGGAWDVDSTGYNFAATLPASAFDWTPELDAGGNPKPRRFRVDVKFTPVNGQPFVVPWSLFVQPVWHG